MDIGQQMQQLYQQFGELPGITIELHKELLAINIENDMAQATVFLQGAQLSHFQPKQQAQAVIWCSPDCDYRQGQSLRGGIPVCWPWFGDPSRNPEAVQQLMGAEPLSAHGIVRNQLWDLRAIEIVNTGHTRLTLSLTVENEPAWPYTCQLQLMIDISDQLQLHWQITNLSQQTLSFSGALHSYFAVSKISQLAVNGLENLNYIDCLDQWQLKSEAEPVIIDREVDRIYQQCSNRVSLLDSGWQRLIHIDSQGSNSAVLWNPWIEKAKRLSHYPDDAYQAMVCLETANIVDDMVTLAAGASHQLSITISTESLAINH
ncbi:D-hexose-6-phosphate mutarotase [Oceanicoccus sp. KOV_DT_Chl]|uniref:D-hexose-6-phosphate mutarotase n=1 Tax=Oceanicoccus sp. KOV_DT_Chl TaxID=1904639 RepID=UPI000C79897A|nr:D-hexose-6-phosphate mutarotase [Oceanicoccus sp. KOV_DT_Chl]